MKKICYWMLSAIILMGLTGCSDFRKPSLRQTLLCPWDNKPALSVGMAKEEIKANWGEPDITNELAATKWGKTKEEWIYWGRYPNVPIDYRYLSRTKHLIFEGDVLVDFFDAEEVKRK